MSSFRRRLMMAAFAGGGGSDDGIHIPSVFQRVEYIDTDGDQYINTGVNTSPDFSAELDLLFLQTPSSATWAMSASNSNGHYWGQSNGVFSFVSSYPTQSPSGVRSQVEYYIDGGYAYIKIGSDLVGFPFSDSAFQWALFAGNGWGNGGAIRFWGGKFYESGVLVRHFIPCYRKSDGKPGLWDMVTWQFYTNAASGTDFTVGPDVIQPPTQYIVFVDRAVEAICAQNWGDGVGITPAQAAAVTTMNGITGSNDAVSFDELQYFTGLGTGSSDPQRCTQNLFFSVFPNVTGVVWPRIAYVSDGTFRGSKFTVVDLPDTVNNIGWLSFANASYLHTLIVRATTPPYLDYGQSIQGNASDLKIYVPYSSDHSILAAYQSAFGWSDHVSKLVELNPEGTIPS